MNHPQEFEVMFSVSGYIKQTIRLLKPGLTSENLQNMLNSGKVVTTVQEGGNVIICDGTSVASLEIIGEVIDVENNLEYEDFEVEDVS